MEERDGLGLPDNLDGHFLFLSILYFFFKSRKWKEEVWSRMSVEAMSVEQQGLLPEAAVSGLNLMGPSTSAKPLKQALVPQKCCKALLHWQ